MCHVCLSPRKNRESTREACSILFTVLRRCLPKWLLCRTFVSGRNEWSAFTLGNGGCSGFRTRNEVSAPNSASSSSRILTTASPLTRWQGLWLALSALALRSPARPSPALRGRLSRGESCGGFCWCWDSVCSCYLTARIEANVKHWNQGATVRKPTDFSRSTWASRVSGIRRFSIAVRF